jgi:hypothetical protein
MERPPVVVVAVTPRLVRPARLVDVAPRIVLVVPMPIYPLMMEEALTVRFGADVSPASVVMFGSEVVAARTAMAVEEARAAVK